MKVSVKVPATSANLGPGFDCFGLALPLYNTVTIEETVYPADGFELNLEMPEFQEAADFHIPTDKTNIVYKGIELLYNCIGQDPTAMKIHIKSDIPIARGLGSSASVIMGGLLAANRLLGDPADEAAILSIANEIEGHPDNITPALVGGLVISSAEEDGSILYRKLDWVDDWKVTVAIPNYELSTSISRSVIPQEISLEDAKFNAKRTAMFIQAVHTQDEDLMKFALQDRLHQPHRIKLVPGLDEITNNLKHHDNVLGTVLSGAGPSIVVISKGNSLDEIKSIIEKTWDNLSLKAQIKTFNVETQGAQFLEV